MNVEMTEIEYIAFLENKKDKAQNRLAEINNNLLNTIADFTQKERYKAEEKLRNLIAEFKYAVEEESKLERENLQNEVYKLDTEINKIQESINDKKAIEEAMTKLPCPEGTILTSLKKKHGQMLKSDRFKIEIYRRNDPIKGGMNTNVYCNVGDIILRKIKTDGSTSSYFQPYFEATFKDNFVVDNP